MKDKRNLHMKVQELCDCYATTDPLKEMAVLAKEEPTEEGALKWIALAALHGVAAGAEKISINAAPDGQVRVVAKYRKSELPSPGTETGRKVFEVAREITHIEGETGRTPLALGIRDGSLEIVVKTERDEEGETLTIRFPK